MQNHIRPHFEAPRFFYKEFLVRKEAFLKNLSTQNQMRFDVAQGQPKLQIQDQDI
jgi:hypothetical protein